MTDSYEPQQIEAAAQAYWDEQQSFVTTENPDKEKFYCLSMLPYPSGQLHMGHVRNYSIGDVISRYQMMQGKNVLQPFGWDSFGLPAENAAIKHKVHPAKWTYQNIADMRKQITRMGFAIDWSREFATCDPDYYRFEQWFFIELYKKGLVYRKNAVVNWDPVDQTVLANEQVVDGKGWRSHAPVERREIPQWFIKITAYADELLDELDNLPGWPEQVKTMQRNWIGRSKGINIHFAVADHSDTVEIFTTRPDTLFGSSFIAIAPNHPLTQLAAADNSELARFIKDCDQTQVAEATIATMEKRGMPTGLHALNPLTGEPIPIWVANFVLLEYGTGAVMGVPAHDQRDFEFAQKYQIEIKQVLTPSDNHVIDLSQAAFTDKGIVINSGEFDGMDFDTAFQAIAERLQEMGRGGVTVNFRLRDWGISRQRYWGAPIPFIHCPDCGCVPVPEADLPVTLPEDVDFTGNGSPLAQLASFVETTCPNCGKAAKRETDTFDTFMESSWYYARYCSSDCNSAMLDERANYWLPVDQYVGGIEHAVMHLLYARFFHKLMRDAGLVNSSEPFTRLLTQGMVLKDGAKMSKSKGNTVDPNGLIKRYGADTVRLFSIFAAPPDQSLEWSDSGVEGCFRFLNRLWQAANTLPTTDNTVDQADLSPPLQQKRRELHLLLRQANFDYERLQFNTVVSACMKIVNWLVELTKLPQTDRAEVASLYHEGMRILLQLLAPIAPHISHHLWCQAGFGDDILHNGWPSVDTAALETTEVTLVVQINGKRRGDITVAHDADEALIETAIRAQPNLNKYLADQPIKKIVVVPKKLVNVVI